MAPPGKPFTPAAESSLVWEFFNRSTEGVFVDIGANHPIEKNQTWFLESKGWNGLLVEPNPALCELLRSERRRSKVIQAAVCGPGDEGEAELHLAVAHTKSSLRPEWDHELTGQKVRVPALTLDSLLKQADLKGIDFLSIDVEGMELEALRGLDLGRAQPGLILLEDHFYDFQKHRYLRKHGYKLVRRTGYNNWYVPAGAPVSVFTCGSISEALRLGRKMWLNTPFNAFRRKLKSRKRRRVQEGS